MERSQIAFLLLSAACTALGCVARELYASIQGLRKDLSSLQVMISNDYVRYDRLQDALKPVLESLQEIKYTLAGKADKHEQGNNRHFDRN